MYTHTNLFRSVINLQGKFDLFKQDSTFVIRSLKANVGYSNANYTVNLTSDFQASRVLSTTAPTEIDEVDLIDFNAQ
jgi:hypothetical protein